MKRYVITSAQSCASPHKNFWLGLQEYATFWNAELIVLPMIGKNATEDWDAIHSDFTPYLLKSKRFLNSNVAIQQFHVRPYQIDPITGLSRFAQRGTTLIFASPKQRLKAIAHSNQKHPKFLITTGACTLPNYAIGTDVSAERRRLGKIAKGDHVFGAVVVEVIDNKIFHVRHLRADKKGVFIDLGASYDGRKMKGRAKLKAMVLGDWHGGQTDPIVRQVTGEMIKELRPEQLILHDFFDGHSVSHHIDKKIVRQKLLHQYDKGFHVLKTELEDDNKDLWWFSKLLKGKKIVIVYSNHHAFLPRYLEEVRFQFEMTNFRLAVKILDYIATKDYNDGVKFGLKYVGKLPKNVVFLKEDSDYKILGYQLGSHGDKGANGGYGSINSKENDFGKSISGHTHSSQIQRDTYIVGTCLPLNMFYMRGQPTSWTHTHALLWENGTVQLIHIIGDQWRGR